MLTWNSFFEDFNKREIVVYNIFKHQSFRDDCKKVVRSFDKTLNTTGVFDREAFKEKIRRELMYYFWSKCEYEIILTAWPPNDKFRDSKIDVYDQVMLNFDVFIDYLWDNRRDL